MDTYIKLKANIAQNKRVTSTTGEYISVEFLVEDPERLDSIMQQIKARTDINFENLNLVVDNTDYQASEKPYLQIRFFSMMLLALGLCGIGIILYLVLKLWIQGRKHEIGILYSIGIKKEEVLR